MTIDRNLLFMDTARNHGSERSMVISIEKLASPKRSAAIALSVLTLLVPLIAPSPSLAQDSRDKEKKLSYSISAGAISAPAYLGSDDYQISIFPNFSVDYGDRLSASLRGIKYTALSNKNWKAGPILSYDFGREENSDDSPFAVSGDSTSDLVGLGDIDGTLEIGGFLEYETQPFVAKLELKQGVDGGYSGLTGEASISYRTRFSVAGRPTFASIGPALSFGDDSYNSAFFDISPAQSAASGINQYDASGGVNSLGLHASTMTPLTRKASLIGFVQYDQLQGDVAESSLVTERGSTDQITAGFLVNYRF